tara:strand:+ start:1446 stop:1787 length:342 start_codon:yes stop_codon:yes gene_type:complete
MTLEENVKKWIILDNSVKELTNRVKEAREKRENINNDIISYVNKNNLTNAKIKISDGNLNFVDSKIAQPLTYKFLNDSMLKFFKDKELTDNFLKFLKSEREIKITKEIKRTYN